jgi:hypothetical protein
LASIDSEFKDKDGIIYLKAVQARMAKIFNDFHFQIWWPCLFIFISCPKNNTPFTKNRREIFLCKKMMGLGAISFDKAFSYSKDHHQQKKPLYYFALTTIE